MESQAVDKILVADHDYVRVSPIDTNYDQDHLWLLAKAICVAHN